VTNSDNLQTDDTRPIQESVQLIVESASKENKDIRFVLLKEGTKKPFQKKWPTNHPPKLPEVLKHLESGGDIGIEPGSIGCVVLDCDEGDGPEAAASWAENALLITTPSSSGKTHRGHVWVRCDYKGPVKNWHFALDDPIDGEARGELKTFGGQVRLTPKSAALLASALSHKPIANRPAKSAQEFVDLRTSCVDIVEPDFEREEGNDVDEDNLPNWFNDRLDDPSGPRHTALYALSSFLKESGVSFNAALDFLRPYVQAWPDDGGEKFSSESEVERHLVLCWQKAKRRPAAAEEFEDNPLPLHQPNKLPKQSIVERGLSVNKDGNAGNTIKNALAAVNRSILCPAFDELKQKVVFTGELPWDTSYGNTLDENTTRLARLYLMEQYQENNYQPCKENVHEAVTTLAYQAKFNPVIDYLDNLKWDGVRRVHELFTTAFPCGSGEYEEAVSRCFMIGAVARQRQPGCKLDTMPVVQGDQGSLKSTGFRLLFGDEWFSDAELGDLGGKDAAMLLSGVWVHEFAELAGLGNSDIDVLKAFMSRAVDRIRPPYGKCITEIQRRAVFAGTVNEGGFLRDHTGGRRFWPLRMPKGAKVNVNWINSNKDQLWAEACDLYNAGNSWVLPETLWPEAAERQAHETTEDPWVDEIRTDLEWRKSQRSDFEAKRGDFAPEADDDGDTIENHFREPPLVDRIHTDDIFEVLNLPTERRNKSSAQRIRRSMEAIGWEYRRGVRIGNITRAGYIKLNE